jgi:hypothetical protein
MEISFTTVQPSECLISVIDEKDNVFSDFGIMLDLKTAIDNEMIATEVVEKAINNLTAS